MNFGDLCCAMAFFIGVAVFLLLPPVSIALVFYLKGRRAWGRHKRRERAEREFRRRHL